MEYFNDVEFLYFYKTALYKAVEKENIEIIKLLLTSENLNVNALSILSTCFYKILNQFI